MPSFVRALAAVLFLASSPLAMQAQPALNDVVRETQMLTELPDRLRLVWWIPTEFWEAVVAQDDTATPEQAEQLVNVLSPYALFLIADGKVGPLGGIDWTPADDLRNGVALQIGDRAHLQPLDVTEVNADAQNLINIMRPMLSGMLGKTGENLQYFFFASGEADVAFPLKATEKGEFTVMVLGEEFRWRLPLGSLLLPKTCPVDGESLNGAWSYCPWHGDELESEQE